MNKNFITSQSLLEDSFRLAAKVYDDGFRPDFIIGIWRGGAPIGIAVQEFFEFKNTSTDHIAVRTSSYYGINKQAKEIRVHGLHYLVENANAEDKLLIVDDVFDSGRSVDALIKQIGILMRLNMPKDIRIACPWYKPANNKTHLVPDYFVNKSEEWLVFPHEIAGLSEEEIREGKKELTGVMDVLFK
ncbi:hypoxanthine phosphoribosyltransferase [Alteromonas pelagimontana]|uniref:Hypoxanthine phosphoribosyltransferase n=1 Tax=Alteromonas pelagimontana TaxID=1858656 RepID=A0A6M4MA98_9ALTE|nr:phosphoribosyltransferase family protein [Alteromonas pelagimontana]QJR79505.1 hypoxanthine phosphoribosyltransferase [Alteromonas pelagimontana]